MVLVGARQAKRIHRGREGKNQERKRKRKAGRKRKRNERKIMIIMTNNDILTIPNLIYQICLDGDLHSME